MSSSFFIKQSKIVSQLVLASAICATSLVLSSCSGNSGVSAAPHSALTIKAPSQYPVVGAASTIPVMVTNNSNDSLRDLQYTVANSTYGKTAGIQIDETSINECTHLAAHQSCQLSVHVPANTPAGAFSVKALNANANPMVNKLKLELNELLNTSYKTEDVATTWVGLTNVAPNLTAGADGLTLYFPTSVSDITQLESANNSVVVTAVVGESAGAFNTVALVDNSGNTLTYTTLTGNSGRGMTDLAAGSVVSMVLSIPNGANQIQFKIQTSQVAADGTETNINTASTLHSVAVLEQDNGMIQISPSYFKLTNESDTQLVIVANNSAYPVRTVMAQSTGSNVLVSNGNPQCRSTLSAGDYCEYSVTFNKNTLAAGMEAILLSYTDNRTMNVETQTSTASYAGATNIGGLSISSSGSFNFSNFTNSSESAIITYTNTGTAEVNNFQTTGLPSAFTLTPAATNPCSTPIVIASGQSCNMVLTYTNSKVTAPTTTPVTTSYSFTTERGYTFNGSSSYALTYQTIQSSAILTTSLIGAPLTTIVNNGVENQIASLKITNNGNDVATNLLAKITGDANSVFSLQSGGTCATSLPAGSSCTQVIQFGPTTTTNVGTQDAILNVDYTPYVGATALTTSLAASGQVATAQSAIITPSVVATGFAGGSGISTDAYQVQQNNASPTLTYIFTNSGTVPATDFQIAGESNISSVWNVQDNCAGKTLDALTSSCSVTLSLNTNSVGSANLDLIPLSLIWSDQAHALAPATQAFAQGLANSTAYTSVFAAASITSTISSSANPLVFFSGNSFVITSTLTGGYNVSQDISANITNDTKNYVNLNNSSCTLSSAQPSCTIAATINTVTTAESGVNLTLSTSGDPITPSSYTFNIAAFYAYATSYKVSGNNILIYSLNPANGHLTQLSSLPNAPKANKIIVDASGSYVYVANADNTASSIAMYAINPLTGLLNSLGAPSAAAGNLFDIAISPNNKFVYGANLRSNTISMYGLGLNGILNPLAPASIATGVSPISIQFTPDGLFAHVVNNNMDTISMYSVATSGQLSPIVPNTVATGSAPVAIRATANGQYAYVANSLDNTIGIYSLNSGVLANIGSATTGTYPNDVAITADSKYVYVVNAEDNTLSMYSIAVNGLLNSLGTIATGVYPRSITIDPTGQYVYVSNYTSGTISIYSIGANGVLSSITTVSTGGANSFPVNLAITPAVY